MYRPVDADKNRKNEFDNNMHVYIHLDVRIYPTTSLQFGVRLVCAQATKNHRAHNF